MTQYSLPGDALTEGVMARRVLAWCVDAVLIAILAWIAWTLMFVAGVLTLGLGFALFALLPAIPFVYHVGFVAGRHAATPGQRMFDLGVRREQDLGPPSLLQAVVFTAGLFLTLASAFLLLLIAPFTPGNRTLHDMVAGVVVVRIRALTARSGFGNIQPGMPYR